jgi:hypothetical protein
MNVLFYNDGVQVWDEHMREYFKLNVILFMIVSNSLVARNLSRQSKKIGCECRHCFRETDCHYYREGHLQLF